eukprot:1161225-Pelagomonas_calceolata.AAC.12
MAGTGTSGTLQNRACAKSCLLGTRARQGLQGQTSVQPLNNDAWSRAPAVKVLHPAANAHSHVWS